MKTHFLVLAVLVLSIVMGTVSVTRAELPPGGVPDAGVSDAGTSSGNSTAVSDAAPSGEPAAAPGVFCKTEYDGGTIQAYCEKKRAGAGFENPVCSYAADGTSCTCVSKSDSNAECTATSTIKFINADKNGKCVAKDEGTMFNQACAKPKSTACVSDKTKPKNSVSYFIDLVASPKDCTCSETGYVKTKNDKNEPLCIRGQGYGGCPRAKVPVPGGGCECPWGFRESGETCICDGAYEYDYKTKAMKLGKNGKVKWDSHGARCETADSCGELGLGFTAGKGCDEGVEIIWDDVSLKSAGRSQGDEFQGEGKSYKAQKKEAK